MNLYEVNSEHHLVHQMGFTFEITNQCMLDCKHCFNRSGNDLIRSEKY